MRILTFETPETVAAYNRQFLSDIPVALERLRRHVANTGGPPLDGSLESLRPFGQWFLERLAANADDDSPDRPVFWNWDRPLAGAGTDHDGPFTAQQVRLMDELHAYYSAVLFNEHPAARWVTFQGEARDGRNGSTLLLLDDADSPINTVLPGHAAAVDLRRGRSLSPDWLYDWALSDLKRN